MLRGQAASAKESWQRGRDAYVTKLCNHYSRCVSKCFGDLLQARTRCATECGVDVVYDSRKYACTVNEDFTTEAFEHPLKINIPTDGMTPTYGEKLMKDWLHVNDKDIQKSVVSNTAAMKEVSNRNGVSCFSSFTDFVWYPDGISMKKVADVATLVHSFSAPQQDSRACVWPTKGMAGVLTCIEGVMLVSAQPPSIMYEYPDVPMWLSTGGTGALSKGENYIINAGESLYMPFGWMPIMFFPDDSYLQKPVRGAKKAKRDAGSKNIVTFSLNLILDVESDGSHTAELRNSIVAQFTASRAWIPDEVLTTIGASEWLKALTAKK